MDFWVDLIATGNLPTILIVGIILVLTGGVGTSIVTGVFAGRRGVKGDALQKEQNAINGLGALTEGQQGFIDRIAKQLENTKAEAKAEVALLKAENEKNYSILEAKFDREVQYSNNLIVLLAQNGIAAPQRPELEYDDS